MFVPFLTLCSEPSAGLMISFSFFLCLGDDDQFFLSHANTDFHDEFFVLSLLSFSCLFLFFFFYFSFFLFLSFSFPSFLLSNSMSFLERRLSSLVSPSRPTPVTSVTLLVLFLSSFDPFPFLFQISFPNPFSFQPSPLLREWWPRGPMSMFTTPR